MRVGIVLTLTFNLPLRKLAAAAIRPQAGGHGDIALTLKGEDRIAYLNLWPHARPWLLKQPQPSLRCVPDAQKIGALVLQAWTAQNTDTLAILGTTEQTPAPPPRRAAMNTHHPSPLGTVTPWPIWALGIFLLVVLAGVTLQMKVFGV
eukprot:gene31732-32387_t